IPAYVVDKARAVEQRHRESFQMYYRAGGRIAMGTDAGTPFNRHGRNAEELAYMVAFGMRSEEHTSELQALMRISYAVFCLKKKNNNSRKNTTAHYYQLS